MFAAFSNHAALAQQEPQGRHPAEDALRVFAVACASCHGPDLAKPKGRFGYVLDLQRIASNPEMVIPGRPDESELWQLVHRDEMPPPDAPTGPLTASQKEAVRMWIEAGASAEPSEYPEPPRVPTPASAEPSAPAKSLRLWAAVGSLHLLVLHFPIALLLSAAVGELWFAWRGAKTPSPAVHFCVLLGSAGAIVAAVLGWVHAAHGHGIGQPATLALHRWLGTVAAGWSAGTAALSVREQGTGVRTEWFRVSLVAGAMLVGAAAHFGGRLVHGPE